MENFDGFIGSIAATLLQQGLGKDTTIPLVVSWVGKFNLAGPR